MKITKRQLRRIIKEAMEEPSTYDLGREDSFVGYGPGTELTDPNVDESQVSASWPDAVTHNGKNVFDTFYSPNAMETTLRFVKNKGYYEAQESYLGYDPDSDTFVMGFDAFLDDEDEYGDKIDAGMEALVITMSAKGRPLRILGSFPGGMYPLGLRHARAELPNLVDIRLD